MLARLEAQQTLPSITVSIVGQTSTSMYGPGNRTAFEQEASLRMSHCVPDQPVAPHPMPPGHMVIQPQPQPPPQCQHPTYLPHVQQLVLTLTQVAPSAPKSYASANALPAPHMALQAAASSSNPVLAGSSQVSCAIVQSTRSSAPFSARPLVASNMANRTPSEQTVSQALQAVANFAKSGDFVESMLRSLPGLQTLLDVPLQPEGCMFGSQGPGASIAPQRALSPVSTKSLNSDEKPGRKRFAPHELPGAMTANDSPTSPHDKRNNVPRSVVFPKPPKLGYKGSPKCR